MFDYQILINEVPKSWTKNHEPQKTKTHICKPEWKRVKQERIILGMKLKTANFKVAKVTITLTRILSYASYAFFPNKQNTYY